MEPWEEHSTAFCSYFDCVNAPHMGPSNSVQSNVVVRLTLTAAIVALLSVVPPLFANAGREGARDLQTRSGSIQEINFLIAEKNWPALASLIYVDPSIEFSDALAHILFRHAANGDIYRLQAEMIERGSPRLIAAIAKTGFAAEWATASTPIGLTRAQNLSQTILRTFPESASAEIQGLLFDTRYVQHMTEPMMRDFFARTSKEFLTSKVAIGYFNYLLERGRLSKEQTRLIKFVVQNGAEIFEAGSSPRTRLKYLATKLTPLFVGGSCERLFSFQ